MRNHLAVRGSWFAIPFTIWIAPAFAPPRLPLFGVSPDIVRQKEIPIMGLVTMMDGYLCPSCSPVTHQLRSPKLAMEKVARDCRMPFLVFNPQNPDMGLLKTYSDRVAKMILKCQPITTESQTLLQRVQGEAGELGVRAAGKFM